MPEEAYPNEVPQGKFLLQNMFYADKYTTKSKDITDAEESCRFQDLNFMHKVFWLDYLCIPTFPDEKT